MITATEIRNRFTTFFENEGHEKLDSSPLIPQNDPTLLFANAGMNQFKDNFTGKANPKNRRATTIQKCVRAGGKHNDLENVGLTARHHTFFEMLGNFSFGDYFKEDAIRMAWKLLTDEFKIPKEKLYVTVHDSDEEAKMIWHNQEGVPLDRIFSMGDKDNFWEMGETGPCGPCSEIFYDHGPEFSDGADTSKCILADEGRYVEIWNLVFMQYEKVKEGAKTIRNDLPKPSIDTGAGLERLAACLQNVYWNYDTDIFEPILSEIEKLTGHEYSNPKYTTNMRIIADHIRSAVMLITDGVIPGNDGRNYVLRRIIRRAVRQLDALGLERTSFHLLIPKVFEKLGDEYPQNKANASLAKKMLKIEEEKFRQTLRTGLTLINKEIKKVKSGDKFNGTTAFKLYDTYGFPLDLTEVILAENKIELDKKSFDTAMAKQKENSKAGSKFAIKEDNIKSFYKIKENNGETKFSGYKQLELKAKLIAIEKEENHTALVFDETPFYAEGGGQVGDIGLIQMDGVTLANIADTQNPVDGLTAHYCVDVAESELKIGENYTLCVNRNSRNLTKRHHSATHILQAALIEVLGDHVKQAGSRVGPDSLRFDFTHPEAVTRIQINMIEKLVNKQISNSLTVKESLCSKDEATQKGAMALFGEKYGNEVRLIEVGNYSLELCGGTHVSNTQEIGLFTITVETSLSSGIRRIEALTSTKAFEYLGQRSELLGSMERSLSVKGSAALSKLESLQVDLKLKNKEIKKLQDQIQASAAKDMFANSKTLRNGIGYIPVNLKDGNPKDFRSISDKFTDQNNKDVLFLYTVEGKKVSYILRTHKKNKTLNCSNILKASQEIVNGRGGGRPDMAQGSGEATNIPKFLIKIENLLGDL